MGFREIKFYLDAHVPAAIARALRRECVDVQTAVEAGLKDEADAVHLAYALQTGRTIVTQDSDFLGFHRQGLLHPGIVYFPQGVSIGHIVESLLIVHGVLSADEMMNLLQYM